MDDRGTRLVGLVLLGIMGLGAVVSITICALARVEVPPSIIAIGATAAGAVAAFIPPATSTKLEDLANYTHQRNHDLLNALNAQGLKMERLLVTLENRTVPPTPP